jgi:hypothetical protein
MQPAPLRRDDVLLAVARAGWGAVQLESQF